MCMMIYIGSDRELTTIPFIKNHLDFYISKLCEKDAEYEGVRKILKKKYLYNAGAHTGCGCGFNYGTYEPIDDIEEERKGKQSVYKLFEYIKDALLINKNIELYTCIAGNEGKNLVTRATVSISQFTLGESFFFDDNELWNIEH